MAQPYIGEIRIFAGGFAPMGWMFCEGQLIPISENDALFAVLGTNFGGDGQETFALPDLRGRLPVHQSLNYPLGQQAGVEEVTLNIQQIPSHTHVLMGAEQTGTDASPANGILATSSVLKPYAAEAPDATMAANAVGPRGGSQPHTNFQPYLCMNYIISLFGIFPTQS
jgi:microcystin-dependent protein